MMPPFTIPSTVQSLLAVLVFASTLRAELITGQSMQNPFFTGGNYTSWTLSSPWRGDGANSRLVFDIKAGNTAGFFSASGAGIDLSAVAPSSPQARLTDFDFSLSRPFAAAFGTPTNPGTYKLFFEVDVLTDGGTYRAKSQEFSNPLSLSGALSPLFTWQGGGFLGNLPGNGGVLLSEINALNYKAIMWVSVPASGTGTGFFTLDNMSLTYKVDTLPVAIWTAGSGNWSTGANWQSGVVPSLGTPLEFVGVGGTSTNNSALSSVWGMTFGANATGSYTVNGTALQIAAAGILNNSTYSQTVATDLTLTMAQSFSAASANLTISGSVSNNGHLLTTNGNHTLHVQGLISGSAGLTQEGNGILILTGNNTYIGTTTISAGTIQIGNSGTSGALSTTSTITNNGTLVFNRSDTITQGAGFSASAIGGTGLLVQNGSGTLVLTGNNTYTGTTVINAGTLQIGSGGTIGSLAATGTITNNGTLVFNRSDNIAQGADFSSTGIGGTGSLIQNGSGTLTLSATNTFGGSVTINSGTIAVSGGNALNNSTVVTVASGGTFLVSTNEKISGLSGSGSVNVGSAGLDITTGTSITNTFSGVLSGSGTLDFYTVSGGEIDLAGNNTATSFINLNGGNLRLSHVDAAKNLTLNLYGTSGKNLLFGAGTNTYNIGAIQGGISIDLGSNTLSIGAKNVATTFSGNLTGTGGIIKVGSAALTLNGSNTYTGTTTINAGTLEIATNGLLGGGNYSGNIVNNGALILGSNSNQTLSGVISGTGALTKNGSGTLTLAGNSNYSGNTTINTGTIVIGNANAAGSGTIFQTDATSLLKFDTTGTITNAMSVHNVLATQSATLSGGITVNNATWDIDTGDTLAISGVVSGNGGVTKTGGGTLVLSGNNTYSAPTVINAGTLNAANAGALGSNNTVQVNGGTLLVSADDAINGMNITLNGSSTTVAGLAFSGNYSGLVDNLTLSKNSIIDLGEGSVSIMFDTIVMSTYMLDIYNWTGTTLWNGGTGNDTDKVYFGPDLSDEALAKIRFHSGAVGVGDSFLGSGYDLGLQPTSWDPGLDGYHIIPVPEPETWATGLLLLLGGAWWMWRKRRNLNHTKELGGRCTVSALRG